MGTNRDKPSPEGGKGEEFREIGWKSISAYLLKENSILVAAGFEPIEVEDELWIRDGLCFGREAAVQRAFGELHEREQEPTLSLKHSTAVDQI